VKIYNGLFVFPLEKVLLARICATIKESAERIKNPNGKPHPSRIANESSKMEEEKKEIVA